MKGLWNNPLYAASKGHYQPIGGAPMSKIKVYVTIVLIITISVSIIIICGGCRAESSTSGTPEDSAEVEVSQPDENNQQAAFAPNIPIYNSIKELYNISDCVVVASFCEEPRNVQISLDWGKGPEKKISYVHKYDLIVTEVIKGQINSDHMTLSQLGAYENSYSVKLKSDTTYLLFLVERNYEKEFDESRAKEYDDFFEDDLILYQFANEENGVFEISPDGLLLSYSDYGYAPTYNNKRLNDLLDELNSE